MICQNLQNTSKKSNIIMIPNIIREKYQYSLKENFFDPAKSSPPNHFMKKIYLRLSHYNSSVKNIEIFDNK
jgi:hypothetical protein